MKKFFRLCSLIVLFLASCDTVSAPPQTSTPSYTLTPSNTPEPTKTLTPTIAPTKTPRPTATLRPELTAAEVGLPWDPSTSVDLRGEYVPCYVNTTTHWHAGDGFRWFLPSGVSIDVVSPIEGKIMYATINSTFGGNIFVETPYIFEGKRVYYQLVHFSTLLPGIQAEITLRKGQQIGTLDSGLFTDPGGKNLLDLMIFATNKGWNTVSSDRNETRWAYLDVNPYVIDDVQSLVNISIFDGCEGNPR